MIRKDISDKTEITAKFNASGGCFQRNAAIVLALGYSLFFIGCENRGDQIIPQAQAMLTPLVRAIEEYHARNGNYPGQLEDIDRDGLALKVPNLRRVFGTAVYQQASYECSADRTFATLTFIVEIPAQSSSDTLPSSYVFPEKRWRTEFGIHFANLYLQHLGRRYRQDKSQPALDLGVEYLLKVSYYGTWRRMVYLESVVEHLGNGSKCELPAPLRDLKDVVVLKYDGSDGGGAASYVFAFETRAKPVMNQLARAIYRIENDDWTEIYNSSKETRDGTPRK